MIERKQTTTTMTSFMNMLEACKRSGETDPTHSLIGLFYDMPFLGDNVLAEPMLTVQTLIPKDTWNFTVVIKPGREDMERIKTLEEYLTDRGVGTVFDKPAQMPELTQTLTPLAKYLFQQTPLSDIQNYNLSVAVITPKVTRSMFTLCGVKYYQYIITSELDLDGASGLTQTFYVLFKEKGGDNENFFSALVGKTLNKAEAQVVLSTIAEVNPTGLFIGGIDSYTQDSGLQTNVWAFSDISLREVSLEGSGTHYVFAFIEGGSTLVASNIKTMEVSRSSEYKYELKLMMTNGKTRVRVYMG